MTEILSRKGPPVSSDKTLVLGDARQMMGAEVMDRIRRVVDQNQDKRAYYLLVASRLNPLDPLCIRTTVALSSYRPPPMLGTMCFHVDNVKGRAERLWVLPLDRPSIIKALPEEMVPAIARIAKGLPIIHG